MVALKLNTNYDAKVTKGIWGAYIKVILLFSGLLHTLRLFRKTATYKQMSMHPILQKRGMACHAGSSGAVV